MFASVLPSSARIVRLKNSHRARVFLPQRQEEAEMQQAKIEQALLDCHEIEQWAGQIDIEESIVASRLTQLEERIARIMPSPPSTGPAHTATIYPLQPQVAAE